MPGAEEPEVSCGAREQGAGREAGYLHTLAVLLVVVGVVDHGLRGLQLGLAVEGRGEAAHLEERNVFARGLFSYAFSLLLHLCTVHYTVYI